MGNDTTFTTKGCTNEANILSQTANSVSTSTGAIIALMNSGSGIELSIPPAFASTSAHFQIKKIDDNTVFATTSRPNNYQSIGSYTYALHAVTDNYEVIESFDQPLTITLTYTDQDVEGINTDTLKIYRWDGLTWNALSNCSTNTYAKQVTCTTDHFSTFSLFGQGIVSTPSVASSPVLISGSSVGSGIVFGCKDNSAKNFNEFSSHKQELCLYESFKKNLKFGNIDNDVKLLQQFLNKQGYIVAKSGPGSMGNETTKFGPATRSALIAYQKKNNIKPAIGYFGPITRLSIK